MRLPFASTRSETSPRVSGVVPLTKYQTGTPVWSYMTMIPGAVPSKPSPLLAGMMLAKVQPACEAVVSLTVGVATGKPAGSAPVVKAPSALVEPPAVVDTALMR